MCKNLLLEIEWDTIFSSSTGDKILIFIKNWCHSVIHSHVMYSEKSQWFFFARDWNSSLTKFDFPILANLRCPPKLDSFWTVHDPLFFHKNSCYWALISLRVASLVSCSEGVGFRIYSSMREGGEKNRNILLCYLYYYMKNFCNLIGLEQWYFSLIWNTYM